jgi:hypothetical protein
MAGRDCLTLGAVTTPPRPRNPFAREEVAMDYQWIVLVHIVGAFIFVLSHGASVWMAMLLRRERDRSRIGAMLEISQASIGGVYVGLLLLLVGGIWAGIAGGHFARGWIWAALGLLVVIIVAMYAIATPFFGRLRDAVGGSAAQGRKTTDGSGPASDADVAALAARTPVVPLLGAGGIGLLLILWLMVLKPF